MTGLIVELLSLAALLVIAVLSFHTRRQIVADDREMLRTLRRHGEYLQLLDERLREGNLKILKCLKGESYAGSFGGLDMHTSTSLPPSASVVFATQEEKPCR